MLQTQARLRATIKDSQRDLTTASRWSRGQRRDLTTTLSASCAQLDASHPQLGRIEQQLDQTARLVDTQTRQRQADQADEATRQRPVAAVLAGLRPVSDLARPRGRQSAPTDEVARVLRPPGRAQRPGIDSQPYRPPPGRDPGGLNR